MIKNLNRFIWVVLLLVAIVSNTWAQSSTSRNLSHAVDEISEAFSIEIEYKPEWLEKFRYRSWPKDQALGPALRQVLAGSGLTFIFDTPQKAYLLLGSKISDDAAMIAGVNKSADEMLSQVSRNLTDFKDTEVYTLRGRVLNGKTGESLTGLTISTLDGRSGVASNLQGEFEITLPMGTNRLIVEGLGYERLERMVEVYEDITLEFEIFEETQVMDEVIISENRFKQQLNSLQGSIEKVSMQTLTELPTFLGEVDVMKAVTTLPGVSSVGEGASGFNVRGGNVDENLIIYDHIPIFNANHLFGFFGVFNADVIRDFELYKGGVPAYYGGRASSVLEVNSVIGDFENSQVKGSIGPVTGKLTWSGAVGESGNTSMVLSGRAAYPNWIIQRIPNPAIRESKAWFYDMNHNLHHRIDENSEITTSFYSSQDEFAFSRDTTYNWSNLGASVNYKSNPTNDFSVEFTGVYSQYTNRILGNRESLEFDYNNVIRYLSLKTHFIKFIDGNDLVGFGSEIGNYRLQTGELTPAVESSSVNLFEPSPDKGLEISLFGYLEKEFNANWSLAAGLRATLFAQHGPDEVFEYENPENPILPETTGITTYENFSFFAPNFGFEPRLNVNYKIDDLSSAKFSLTRNRQNIHIISNSLAVAPTDFWKLSDNYIQPTIADQVSVGYFRNFRLLSLSAETFYKISRNVLNYRFGSEIFLNPQIETSVIRTQGRAYGAEFKVEKRGALNGWISYSYTNSVWANDIGDRLDNEFGNTFFPTDFVRPHVLSINMNYKLTKRLSMSANFFYASGRPISLPESAYSFYNEITPSYSSRNAGNIPDYHRFDLSFMLKGNLKKQKVYDGTWVFSLYNVYGRKNPFSVFFDTTSTGILPQAYKLSILGSVFPSVTYSFTLNQFE